jgi:hypothetical protein
MTDADLFEQSFNIAWSVLEQSGDLGQADDASRFLLDKIADMMRSGERRRLLLSNSAIDAYRLRYRPLVLV